MSTNELNTHLNSFQRPEALEDQVWNQILHQSREVWNAHLRGEDWNSRMDIFCKEHYLMLVNRDGKLIIRNDNLLNYVRNRTNNEWRSQLEEIAFRALHCGMNEKADRYFGKAIKLDSSVAANYYRRASVRIQLGRYKDALSDLNEAIARSQNQYMYYVKRAEVYRLMDIDHKAMSDLNTAIGINPRGADAYKVRGLFRISLGDRIGGRTDILKSEELQVSALGNAGHGLKAA